MSNESDFADILNQQAGQAERPKPLPNGTYTLQVEKFETGESSQKKTKFLRFIFKVVAPGEDVDHEEFSNYGGQARLQSASMREDFYLTKDALFRLDEFLEKLGIEMSGRSYNEVIPETPGKLVNAFVGQRVLEPRPGDLEARVIAEIRNFAPAE